MDGDDNGIQPAPSSLVPPSDTEDKELQLLCLVPRARPAVQHRAENEHFKIRHHHHHRAKEEVMEQMKLLIVNPNSSKSVTDSLESVYSKVAPAQSDLFFFTAPPSAPPAINDTETSEQSTAACLPALIPLLEEYDGFLIACYSAHPLVRELGQLTRKPVLGIFESSVTHALLSSRGFGIVTTGPTWEPLLSEAVNDFLGGPSARFVGVRSTGLGVLELHEAPEEVVRQKMCAAALELVRKGADGLCLGCAGMAGLGKAIQEAVGDAVKIIDVTAGLWELEGLVRCRMI